MVPTAPSCIEHKQTRENVFDPDAEHVVTA